MTASPRSATARNLGAPGALAIAGALLLIVGTLLPIFNMPAVGSTDYFRNGDGDGVLIIGLALISILLVLLRRYRGLWVTGALTVAIFCTTFFTFNAKMAELRATMESQLAGNPFIGLARSAVDSVQPQWGWAVLVLGVGLLFAAIVANERRIGAAALPAPADASPTAAPAGWFADPLGRHELRYWDGSGWTAHVATQGVRATDPLA